MKTALFILLAALCYVQCRKIVQVDQHANTAFINMEEGGPPKQPAKASPVPAPAPAKPTPAPDKQILTPVKPTTASVKLVENHPPVTLAKPNVPVQPAKVESTKPGVICPYSLADDIKQGGESRFQLSFTDNGLRVVYNIDCRFCHINFFGS